MRVQLGVVILLLFAFGPAAAAADLDASPIRYSTAATDNAITNTSRK